MCRRRRANNPARALSGLHRGHCGMNEPQIGFALRAASQSAACVTGSLPRAARSHSRACPGLLPVALTGLSVSGCADGFLNLCFMRVVAPVRTGLWLKIRNAVAFIFSFFGAAI